MRFLDDDELAAAATAQAQPAAPPPTPAAGQQGVTGTPVALTISESPVGPNGRTPGWRIARTDGQGVRLRANPSSGASTVAAVVEGTLVDPLEGPVISDGLRWIQVQAPGGRRGWVADSYLEPPPIPTVAAVRVASSPAVPGAFIIARTDGAGANVRERPSTAAPVLGNLAEGSVVEPLEGPVSFEDRAWQKVRGAGLEGWVVAVVVRPR